MAAAGVRSSWAALAMKSVSVAAAPCSSVVSMLTPNTRAARPSGPANTRPRLRVQRIAPSDARWKRWSKL